jgi:hypothetical protein
MYYSHETTSRESRQNATKWQSSSEKSSRLLEDEVIYLDFRAKAI